SVVDTSIATMSSAKRNRFVPIDSMGLAFISGRDELVPPRYSKHQARFPGAAFDTPDWNGFQERFGSTAIALGNDHRHANAHIEYLIHFLAIDSAIPFENSKDRWDSPAPGVDHGVAVIGQNPGKSIHQHAAGDVGE